MGFAIVISKQTGYKNRTVGWTATAYPVNGYDDCCESENHSKPNLECPIHCSKRHDNPRDAIAEIIPLLDLK